MPEYLSPGVYVEEIDRGPKPIEGVGTAMPVFVGFSEKAELTEQVDGETITTDVLGKAQLVTNWTQYVERFGGIIEGAYMPHSVYGYFMNGGSRCYVLSVKSIPRAQAGLLGSDGRPQLQVKAKQAGFDGLRLRVIVDTPTSPSSSTSTPPKKTASTKTDDKTDEKSEDKTDDKQSASASSSTPSSSNGADKSFTLTVERQGVTGAWQTKEVLRDISLVEVETDDKKEIRVVYPNNKTSQWIDLVVPEKASLTKLWPTSQEQTLSIEPKMIEPASYTDFQGDVLERTGIEGLEALDDVTMVCVPDLMTPMPNQKLDLDMVKAVQALIIAHCERTGDRVAILDAPPNLNPQKIKNWRMDIAGFDSSYAALYYPWIQVMDPIKNRPILIPPSGHMAGIWARNDNTRGVHKAPANEVVAGATGLAYNVTKGEQDVLNPNAINCIRAFPGMGIRVWGARTVSSNPSWRYINVRRLFNFVEKSIERGTQWVVFEPNEPMLWARIRRDVTAFLTTVWSSGALFGNTPNEAFYVKCDEELNPPRVRDQGQLIIEIGMAPVKPAEFVIFRISQWSPGDEI
ncbi:MAG TPA: phage tail sheath subtilisin-like domain-containing protein [Anaerolineae bacterium]|nr:phage tail sheath subtilisin-like domain-containing protein [Anaerolineae bacterium]